MKKTKIFLGFFLPVIFSGFIFSNTNNLNQKFNGKNTYLVEETYVSSYDELESAFSSKDDVTIVFENDIDLSNFTPEDTITNNKNSLKQDIIIDGNGYGFVNKPSKYYAYSIFDNLIINYEKTVTLTFRNLTLDNVGSFIGDINYLPTVDYEWEFSDPLDADLIGQGLTFQNITIENNVKENETFYLTPYKGKYDTSKMYQPLSFLANSITVYHNDFSTKKDEAVNFKNIIVKNNHIDNNTFYIQNDSSLKPKILESFITNLQYIPSNNTPYTHHSFITYEYIYIENNSFTNNTFKIGHYLENEFIFDNFDSSIQESFGHLSGNANGLKKQPGNNGNYLYIHDIYISNNIVTESKKINADGTLVTYHYNYSELISNPKEDQYTQYISTLVFNNIVIFNNEAYYLSDSNEYNLYSQEDINLLDFTLLDKDNNSSDLINLNLKNIYVYGPMYDSSKELNIFSDVYTNNINWVNYDNYLFTDDNSYIDLINFLSSEFGIYGYEINYQKVEDDGEIKNAVSSVSKVEKEHIDIFYDNLIYTKNNSKISQIELSFKYYQNIEQYGVINNPYIITNIKLYNDQNQDQKFESDEIIANSSDIYNIENNIYNVTLDMNKKIKFNNKFIDNLDLNNLYLGFDYSNEISQKTTSSTILKIDSNQLKENFYGFPKVSNFWLIFSLVLILILIIISIILLLILLLKNKKNNKNEKEYKELYENVY